MNENTNNRKLLVIIGIVILAIIIIVISIATGGKHPANTAQQTGTMGTVTLHYSTTDIASSVVKFNDAAAKPASISGSSATYTVAPGIYKLSVSDPGYTSFSTNFSIQKGQTVIVVVHIKVATTSTNTTTATNPTITNASQLTLAGVNTADITITGVTYFNTNTWAVVSFQSNGNTGIAVVQYNAANKIWLTQLGPGTQFTPDGMAIENIPQNVQDYLTANNYVNPEGE
jgi:hypothetical protein